jgi:6-phosphogluconolactonase
MHPSGKFVYASNRSANSTIAVFKIGPNGALTLVEHASTRGATTRNFGIDPSGQWLIAANQGSGTLAVFRIDQNTGTLTPAGGLTEGIAQPVCVIFM